MALALVGVAAGASVVAGERVADAADVSHEQYVVPGSGFIIGENGDITDIPANATNELAFPVAINNLSVSAGEYVRYDDNGNGVSESALYRAANGEISTFNVGAGGTEATDINDAGDIVGNFSSTPIVTDATGFLRDGDTLEVRTIARETARVTAVNANNDRGELVGIYRNDDGVDHGFYWIAGKFTTVDVSDAYGTRLLDINDLGQIVGVRINQDGSQGTGFLLDSFTDQTPTTISLAGYAATSPQRINDRGQILVVASNDDFFCTIDAFLLPAGVGGPVTEVNVRDSPYVLASGLNDRIQIVGIYQTADVACPGKDVARKEPVTSNHMAVAALALAVVPVNAYADTTPAYNFEDIRNGIVDATGTPVPAPGKCSDSYVDKTCPGHTLVAYLASGHGYVGHAGQVTPGSVVTVSYLTAGGLTVHSERPAVGPSGAIERTVTDLRSFMSPGDTLVMRVRISNGEISTNATAIEYGLIAA